MSFFFISDNANFKWKIGSDSTGLTSLPIYEACKIQIHNVINSSTTINANSTKEFEFDSSIVTSTIGEYHPYLISGFDLTADVGIYIQKIYVEAGSKLIKVRLANMSSSNKSASRLAVRVVYHLKYNDFIRY